MRALVFIALVAWVGACSDDGPGGNGGEGGDGGGGGEGANGGGGGEGASGGGSLFHCELGTLEAPLCAGPSCPLSNMGRLDCENRDYFFIQVQSAADGAPSILLDPAAHGHPLLLADTSANEVSALADVSYHASFATDDEGRPSFSYVPADVPVPWYFQELGGEAEIVGGEGVSYWVPRGLAARGTARYAIGLRSEPRGPETLVFATREAAGQWAMEELGSGDLYPLLELSEDGTPLIAFHDDQQRLVIQVGDMAPQPVDLAPDTQAHTGFAIVPGASGWEAAAYLDATRLVLLRPSLPAATTEAYAPGDFNQCDPFAGGNGSCSGPCNESGTGVSSALNPFAVDGGLALLFAERTVDRTGHFEEGECTEAGCPCEYVVDSDESFIDLVLVRFDATTSELSELGRFPLPAPGEHDIQVDTSRRGDTIAFALSYSSGLVFGEIDASAL